MEWFFTFVLRTSLACMVVLNVVLAANFPHSRGVFAMLGVMALLFFLGVGKAPRKK